MSAYRTPGPLVYFDFGFTALQDYFPHFELSQSFGEAKMENPQGKPPDQAELGLSHICPELGSSPQQ